MQIDYIRRDVPEEISEEGGAFIQIVNKSTLGLSTSIEEAKSTLHVVGAAPMIEGYFVGIMRSVFEGIQLDGHPRTVGDITFFPVCGGTFDLDKGWDPLVNDVRIKARLVNGVTIDITGWTFRDVTPGRLAYSIDTVSDGSVTGQVSTNKSVELNGRNFPAKSLLSISWVCGTKSGTVDAAKFTANVARLTIDQTAFSSLTSSDDGKEIVFTVKGCYNKATAKAVVKYCGPALVRASSSIGTLAKDWGKIHGAENIYLEGTNLAYTSGDCVKIANSEHTWTFTGNAITSGSDTELVLDYMRATREDGETCFAPDADGPLTITYKTSTLAATYQSSR